MRARRVQIVGTRGDWTAKVEGQRLAVLHSYWRETAARYFDLAIGAKLSGKRYQSLIHALRNKDKVVIEKNVVRTADNEAGFVLDRDSYVGVFFPQTWLFMTRERLNCLSQNDTLIQRRGYVSETLD